VPAGNNCVIMCPSSRRSQSPERFSRFTFAGCAQQARGLPWNWALKDEKTLNYMYEAFLMGPARPVATALGE
jgi:hypothetical protein